MNRLLAIAAALLLTAAGASAVAEESAATPAKDAESTGKVIEFDADGNAKAAPKEAEAPLKKGEISQAESCRLRLGAQCKAMRRCGIGDDVFPCEALIGRCAELQGKAPYSRKAAEGCAKGLGNMKCVGKVDFANPASLNPAAQVPACREVLAAEQKQFREDAGKNKKNDFAPSDFSSSEFRKTSDFSPSDFSPSDFSPSDFKGGK